VLLPTSFKEYFYYSDVYGILSPNILYQYNKKIIIFDHRLKIPYTEQISKIISYDDELESQITNEKDEIPLLYD
jgi:hypothetical protein